jgi:phosphatidylserine/phosphatidylglycerophosphate/cardiolipin synthase-like enzyme
MDFVRQRRAMQMELVGGRGHYEAVVQRVLGAERSVWIATANLKELMVEDSRARPGVRRRMPGKSARYRSVLAAFEEQVLRGVDIRLLHAGEPSRPFKAELARRRGLSGGGLAAAGRFEMRQCPRVHFKAVVIDGAEVYLGSANWTGAGLGAKHQGRRNFELGFLSRDDLLLDEVQSLYDQLWSGAHCGGCRLRAICPGPLDAPRPPGPVPRSLRRRNGATPRSTGGGGRTVKSHL